MFWTRELVVFQQEALRSVNGICLDWFPNPILYFAGISGGGKGCLMNDQGVASMGTRRKNNVWDSLFRGLAEKSFIVHSSGAQHTPQTRLLGEDWRPELAWQCGVRNPGFEDRLGP